MTTSGVGTRPKNSHKVILCHKSIILHYSNKWSFLAKFGIGKIVSQGDRHNISDTYCTFVTLILLFQADFSLLFHASVGNNKVAVEKLLEAGADPTLTNLKGTNVFMMFVKRGQIEMADMCLAKVVIN